MQLKTTQEFTALLRTLADRIDGGQVQLNKAVLGQTVCSLSTTNAETVLLEYMPAVGASDPMTE